MRTVGHHRVPGSTASLRGTPWYRLTPQARSVWGLGYPSRDINTLDLLEAPLSRFETQGAKRVEMARLMVRGPVKTHATIRVAADGYKVIAGKLSKVGTDDVVRRLLQERPLPHGYDHDGPYALRIMPDFGDDTVTNLIGAKWTYEPWIFNADVTDPRALQGGSNGVELTRCTLRFAPGAAFAVGAIAELCDVVGPVRSGHPHAEWYGCDFDVEARGVEFTSPDGCTLRGTYRDCTFDSIFRSVIAVGAVLEGCEVSDLEQTECHAADMLGTKIKNMAGVRLHPGALRGALLDDTFVLSTQPPAKIDLLLAGCVDAPTGGASPRYRQPVDPRDGNALVHTWAVVTDPEPEVIETGETRYPLTRVEVRAAYRAKILAALRAKRGG